MFFSIFLISILMIGFSSSYAPSHPEYVGFEAPLKQVAQGIEPEAVTCNEGLVLIIKYNGSPACVKPTTAEKLIERGWAFETSSIDSYDDCVAAGNDVLEWLDEEGGWGRHCYTPDGKKFVVDCNKFLASCT